MNIELKKWNDMDFSVIGDIFTRCDRSYLSDGLPMPYTAEHARGWFESTVLPRDGKDGLYRILFVDGKPAGVITIGCDSDVYAWDADLGYVLLDEFKGQGVMTRAVELICAEAFQNLDILRISARVYAPNAASRRVLEKNGFILEGTKKNAVVKDGNIYDMLLYGKLK